MKKPTPKHEIAEHVAKVFKPHDYQRAIIEHIIANPRCAVLAGMGTGKTAPTLTSFDILSLVEPVFPVLVVGPLRVIQSTWPNELATWQHLSHLRMSVVVGTATERRLALEKCVEIYCINYENLTWLENYYGPAWPFRTVVADESTKLKHFRHRHGTKRALALGRVAHSKVQRFIELTGTPCPNGVIDLWGQLWFLDRGKRLGQTFDVFTDRWFYEKRYGFGPLPHAQNEIQEKIRDLCLTVTAADYLDLPPLITNDVVVDLPPAARLQYDEMAQKMFVSIAEHGINAPHTAACINKCLQLVAGAVYIDDHGNWISVHDAKLDALEDIIEEAAGMPVLVSIMFKSDLARILTRFGKRARHLDRNPQTVIDWNAGQIPILCAHPASAGHGLNLQHGSNIIAYFSSGWNLEHDMQILERIGPTRQLQSGLNREVYVHRIIARDTVDVMVAERREGKKSVQQILLDYMKRNVRHEPQ